MAYEPQFGKTDTLAEDLDAEATTATLTSGNFTNFTTDFLVVDYDVPAKREVILCTVTGTAITSITRAQDGTSDVDHSAGAKVGYMFVPSHYGNGLGKIAENDVWTSWTPVWTGFSADPTITEAKYIQIGKIVFARLNISVAGTSNATSLTVTLPVAAKAVQHLLWSVGMDNNASLTTPGRLVTVASSAVVTAYKDDASAVWTNSGNKYVGFSITYEAV